MAAFKKGQSGNPGGRPKDEAQIRQLAREHSPAAILRLVDWMQSDEPKASVAAAQALLDRGYGKPAQSVHLGDADGNPLQIQIVDPTRRANPTT